MGIVAKQSFQNTAITYAGFAIGALNTLFLYTRILLPEHYGLVTFILATGALLMPLMAFGTHNTLVKFYIAQPDAEKNGFLTLMLLSPLFGLIPLAVLVWLFYADLASFLSIKNALVYDYVWHVFLVGTAMAYFEVFYAWSKVQLRSVFGNFLKEVFARLGVLVLLGLYHFQYITLDSFFVCLVAVYMLRTFIMKAHAYGYRWPKLDFNFPRATKEILLYSLLIILGGSASLVLMEVDKFMINQLLKIENVAFYGVAVYIATVIIVPYRSMHHITYPLTADLLNKSDFESLKRLYQKSSLTLFIASGILFLLIVLNLEALFELLPETYRGGFYIVFLIGLARVSESLLGNNNSILYNSEFYRAALFFGVLVAVFTVVLNLLLIPQLGIDGAALASCITIVLFNILKIGYVWIKFKMYPFTKNTFKVFGLLVLLAALFWYLQFPFHPLINIFLKSTLMVAMYVGVLYRFNISEDVSALIAKVFRKKT